MRIALFSPSDYQQTALVQSQTSFVKALNNFIDIDYVSDANGSYNNVPFVIASLRNIKKYDVLHFQWGNNPLHYFELLILERLKMLGWKKPIVSTIHEIDLQYLIKAHPQGKVLSNYLIRNEESHLRDILPASKITDYLPLIRIIKNSDLIVTHSQYATKRLLKEFPFMKVPPEKIKLAKLGINTHEFASERTYDKHSVRFNPHSNKVIFLYVGFLHKIKSIDLVIKAFANIKKEQGFENFFFLVVGKGPEKERLKSLAKKLIPDLYHFTDFVEDLSSYYALCDVVINPRAFSRGEVSGVVPEVFSSEKPVIAPDQGCNKEYISEKTGMLVSKNSISEYMKSILLFIKDPQQAKIKGKAAKNYAKENLDWERQAPFFVKQYNSLLKKKGENKTNNNRFKLLLFDSSYKFLSNSYRLLKK